MSAWLPRRVAEGMLTFVLAITLLFFLMRLTPGDPLSRLTEDRPLPPEAIAALRTHYGLDQPLGRQFLHFLGGALHGDLGVSIAHAGRPVADLLGERLPASLLLGGVALFLNFLFGMGIGVWQAARPGSAADRALSFVGLAAYAAPSFWIAIVLAWAFGTELRWFPVAFMHDPLLPPDAGLLTRVRDVAWHLVLPAATLSIVTIGATARYQRTAMMEALALEAVRTARAKGLTEPRVRWRHAWPNAVGPMLALFGLWLPILVTGSVFVEAVFAWPGLGTLAAEAIASRDYPVIMGTAILVAASVVAGSLAADLLHRWVDPRLRHE